MRRDEQKPEFQLDVSDEDYDQVYSLMLGYRERVGKIDKILTSLLASTKSKVTFFLDVFRDVLIRIELRGHDGVFV